jgi:hypothetical protein
MAIELMDYAVPGKKALAAGYNTVVDNVIDLDSRLSFVETRIGGEYRAASDQVFPAWGANKLTFTTELRTPVGIVYNGSNMFTVTHDGLYAMSALVSFPYNASNNALLGIGKSSITGAGATGELYTGWCPGANGCTDLAVSGTRFLTAGAQICVWLYINGGSSGSPLPASLDDSPRAEFSVWKVG